MPHAEKVGGKCALAPPPSLIPRAWNVDYTVRYLWKLEHEIFQLVDELYNCTLRFGLAVTR